MKPAELEFVTIGQVLVPWGNKGKLKVKVVTDFPERFTPSAEVYINRQSTTIESSEWHRGNLIVKLGSVDNIEAAQRLRGQPIEIPQSQLLPLPEGHYYHFQLIGLEVLTIQGDRLGNITEIITAQSNDVYIVRGDSGEILIPAIEDVIKSIDLDKGQMVIEPIEGLLNSKPRGN